MCFYLKKNYACVLYDVYVYVFVKNNMNILWAILKKHICVFLFGACTNLLAKRYMHIFCLIIHNVCSLGKKTTMYILDDLLYT
jgi:hypothetical protein